MKVRAFINLANTHMKMEEAYNFFQHKYMKNNDKL